MRRVVIEVALVLASSAIGFSDEPGASPLTQSRVSMATYVVGVIGKGPNWGTGTPSERQRIQDGHVANIRKMANTWKLLTAGPFENDELRGLFIFGTSSTEEARALVNTDPPVVAGRLTVDLYQRYAPAGLRVDLESVSADPARERVVKIVSQVQRADYEGDRTALNRLYDQLVPFVDEPGVASRVRYWRGFAKWRRAINGFNETPTPKDLAEDLAEGESEFDAAIQRDPGFVDAKVGAASCLVNRLLLEGVFANEKNPQRFSELLAPASLLLKEAAAAAPDNPRFLWVVGPNQWNTPPERGGGQDKAIATYQRGLEAIHAQKGSTSAPLEPSWGEPELLTSLAWSNLHRDRPDLSAAQQYAQAALKLVPYWHYVRDILIPQIRDAQAKATKG